MLTRPPDVAKLAEQLGMAARSDQPPLLEDMDRIAPGHRLGTMGDNDDRGPGRLQFVQGIDDGSLGRLVKRAGRFVEDHDRRLLVERARQGQTLPLAARQADAAFSNPGVIAVWQALDEVVQLRLTGSGMDPILVRGCAMEGEGDVGGDAVVGKEDFLRDVGNRPSPARQPVRGQRHAVDGYAALARLDQAH